MLPSHPPPHPPSLPPSYPPSHPLLFAVPFYLFIYFLFLSAFHSYSLFLFLLLSCPSHSMLLSLSVCMSSAVQHVNCRHIACLPASYRIPSNVMTLYRAPSYRIPYEHHISPLGLIVPSRLCTYDHGCPRAFREEDARY